VIDDVHDWDHLKRPDFSKPGSLVAELIGATRILAERLGTTALIRAEAECGPFTLAGELMGVENFLSQTADPARRADVHSLIGFLTEVITDLCLAQSDAGAHLVGIGDPLAGPDLLSPVDYMEFAYPYQMKLADGLRRKGIDLVIHMCGDITKIFRHVAGTGATAVELDYKVDAGNCRAWNKEICIFGNVDPSGVLALGTPEEVRQNAKSAIMVLGSRGHFILGPGCDLPYHTPKTNIHALVDAAKAFGAYRGDRLAVG
jgi:uroporphyrinogen decarboxylase